MGESKRGFRLVDAMVTGIVIVIFVGLVVAILWPALCGRGKHGPQIQSNSNLRSMAQAMHIYADGNNAYFPGLNRDGEPEAIDVEQRMFILIDSDMIDPEALLSPFERSRDAWEGEETFNSEHYSYAMLQIPEQGGRYDAWHDYPVTTGAVVASDRNTGTRARPASVQSDDQWRGGIVRHDVSTSQHSSHLVTTDYGAGRIDDDHLFEPAGDDDAYMIYEGN